MAAAVSNKRQSFISKLFGGKNKKHSETKETSATSEEEAAAPAPAAAAETAEVEEVAVEEVAVAEQQTEGMHILKKEVFTDFVDFFY